MKRTRELIFREHPPWQERSNISNCQFFDGEDAEFYHRQKSDSSKQKQWLEQQTKENKLKAELKLMEDKLLGNQVLHLNRQRGILQDHVQGQKKALVQAQNQKNLELVFFSIFTRLLRNSSSNGFRNRRKDKRNQINLPLIN